jgi:hypothetical protein
MAKSEVTDYDSVVEFIAISRMFHYYLLLLLTDTNSGRVSHSRSIRFHIHDNAIILRSDRAYLYANDQLFPDIVSRALDYALLYVFFVDINQKVNLISCGMQKCLYHRIYGLR